MARPISEHERSERARDGTLEKLPDYVWADRLRRCREAAAREEIHLLLVYSGGYEVGGYEWARYLANYVDPAPLWAGETWMAIPLEGEPTLFLIWPQMLERARRSSPISDIRVIDVWSSPEGARHDLVGRTMRDYLAERGLARGRIGFGHGGRGGSWMAYTPGSVEAAIRYACAEGTMVDAGHLLWEITRVKTEYDICGLRRAAEVNCQALGAALHALREGVAEHELFGAKITRACDLGAEVADPEHAQLAVIHPGGLRPFYVTGYRFRHGDMFTLDSGCSVGGYESDIARNAVIGEPSQRQQRAYESCMEIARRLEEALRPGATACDLWEIMEREANRLGYETTQAMAGHGVGISKNEAPFLAPWDQRPIEEGMVINLEPALFDPPDACFTFEETYVARATGPERITPLSSELFIA